MLKKRLWILALIFIFTFSLTIAGCAEDVVDEVPVDDDEVDAPVDTDKVLKVGVLGPFTGPASRTGEEFRGAVEMAFDRVDNRIGDYAVEFVWIDSQSDPERATRAYEEAAVRDQIDAGILNWHSSVAVAAMDVAARNQVPHFFGFGATEVVNEKYESDPDFYSYWMGKTWPTPSKLTGAYLETLEEAIDEGLWEPRNKRFAVYGEDTDWGRSFGAAIAADFEAAGWEIVGEEYFAVGETELVPLLLSLRDMDASVVAGTVATAPSFAAFITQAQEVGIQSVIIADGLGWIGEWYEMTGDASNYVLDQIPAWTTDEAKQFVIDFEEKYGFTPSTSGGGLAYDQASFFIQVAEATLAEYGELSRETLYEYGQSTLWTGGLSFTDGIIMEEYMYAPESVPDPVVGQGYFIFPVIQYFEGEGSIVWPGVWKESDFQVPTYLE